MIRHIIFDMDGTLVDTIPLWERVRIDLSLQHGYTWTKEDRIAVDGLNSLEWSRYLIKKLHLGLSPHEVQNLVINRLAELYQQNSPFRPGAIEAVKWAASRCVVGLASGSPHVIIKAVTGNPQLKGLFSVILSADEVKAGKPAPDVYLEALRRLQASPESALCVEDSGNGIVAGKTAGLKVAAVRYEDTPVPPEQLARADFILPSLIGFSDMIEPLLN